MHESKEMVSHFEHAVYCYTDPMNIFLSYFTDVFRKFRTASAGMGLLSHEGFQYQNTVKSFVNCTRAS
jgi:hypothetical protein